MNEVKSKMGDPGVRSFAFGAVLLIGLFGIPAAVHLLAVLAA